MKCASYGKDINMTLSFECTPFVLLGDELYSDDVASDIQFCPVRKN